MESDKNHNYTSNQTSWAIASLGLSIFGCLFFTLLISLLISGSLDEPRILSALALINLPLFWIISFISGIVALIKIRRNPTSKKGKLAAILGLCITGASVIFIISTFVYVYIIVFIGKPFDESHPSLVVSVIEKTCEFNFPDKVENLEAADKIAPGVDPGYVILIVRFTTDQNGLAHLQNSLRQLDSYIDETAFYKTDDYPLVKFQWPGGFPKWYNIDVTKGIIYSSYGTSKNNEISLYTTCVKSDQPEKIDVFMEGICEPSLNEKLN